MNEQLQPNERLLKIMEARELREAKEAERLELERMDKEANHELRVKTQVQADQQMWDALSTWQARCDHRKGTSGKKKWKHIDFNVNRHTFQNGLVQIKCLKCKMKWYPGDTRDLCAYTMDNAMKKIRKTKNPTGLSYADAYQMTLDENTTNTETRSEMVTQGPVPVTA